MKLKEWLNLLRVQQYYKNLLIFVAAFFAGRIFQDFFILFLGFLSLCLISSAIYIINDLKDIKSDRNHPEKKRRPLASGSIKISFAIITAILFTFASLVIGKYLGNYFIIFPLFIFFNSLLYTFFLKRMAILDIHSISLNYIARAISGGIVIGVYISPWFILFIFILSLLFTITKRKSELELKKNQYPIEYNEKFIEWLIIILITISLLSYILYTFFVHQGYYMMFTIPVVNFMIFRYLYLVSVKHKISRKMELFFTDIPLLITFILWLIICYLNIYIKW